MSEYDLTELLRDKRFQLLTEKRINNNLWCQRFEELQTEVGWYLNEPPWSERTKAEVERVFGSFLDHPSPPWLDEPEAKPVPRSAEPEFLTERRRR